MPHVVIRHIMVTMVHGGVGVHMMVHGCIHRHQCCSMVMVMIVIHFLEWKIKISFLSIFQIILYIHSFYFHIGIYNYLKSRRKSKFQSIVKLLFTSVRHYLTASLFHDSILICNCLLQILFWKKRIINSWKIIWKLKRHLKKILYTEKKEQYTAET